MSNQFFTKGRAAFMKGQINLLGDNIKTCLLSRNFTGGGVTLDTLEFYSELAGEVLTGGNAIRSLTNKNVTPAAHYFADNVVFSAMTAGQRIGYILIFQDTGGTVDGPPAAAGAARLIALIDSGYGLGAGTNGTDVTVEWDATDGIIKL